MAGRYVAEQRDEIATVIKKLAGHEALPHAGVRRKSQARPDV
jgi:hypothetical protein